ncbi:MAG: peptide chain release factor N(5)-glutamine methyltransferase [Candidatus Omnitrophota bacterium]
MRYLARCAMPNESLRKNNIVRIINDASLKLSQAGAEAARRNAEELLAFTLGIKRSFLYIFDNDIQKQQLENFHALIERFISGCPLQYILGETEFYGLRVKTQEGVFIPRPETEILVEAAIAHYALRNTVGAGRIMDVGTGGGNIAICLTKLLNNCRIYATDISQKALELARANAALNGVSDKIDFFCGDLFEAVNPLRNEFCERENFDLIVSNPPYIPSGDIAGLAPCVQREPRLALDGGADGLDFYRRIVNEAPGYLNNGGFVVFEMGDGQRGAVGEMLSDKGFSDISTVKDYNGIERVIKAVWTN